MRGVAQITNRASVINSLVELEETVQDSKSSLLMLVIQMPPCLHRFSSRKLRRLYWRLTSSAHDKLSTWNLLAAKTFRSFFRIHGLPVLKPAKGSAVDSERNLDAY